MCEIEKFIAHMGFTIPTTTRDIVVYCMLYCCKSIPIHVQHKINVRDILSDVSVRVYHLRSAVLKMK